MKTGPSAILSRTSQLVGANEAGAARQKKIKWRCHLDGGVHIEARGPEIILAIHGDYAGAVRGALALFDAVSRLAAPEPLQVLIGIATGLVVAGDLRGGQSDHPGADFLLGR